MRCDRSLGIQSYKHYYLVIGITCVRILGNLPKLWGKFQKIYFWGENSKIIQKFIKTPKIH